MPVYVVRSSRTRHADRDCPRLLSVDRSIERYQQDDPEYVSGDPAEEWGIYVVTFATDPEPGSDLARWLETFTIPCLYCVPGARDLWETRPEPRNGWGRG